MTSMIRVSVPARFAQAREETPGGEANTGYGPARPCPVF